MGTQRAVAAAGTLGLLAVTVAPAAAAPAVSREVFEEPWQETIACGDVVGVASGTSIQRVHLRENTDGTVDFLLNERVADSRFTGSDGHTYRVVGAGSASGYVVVDENGEEQEQVLERHVINLVIVGDRGRLGGVHVRWDGSEWTSHGNCDFAPDQE